MVVVGARVWGRMVGHDGGACWRPIEGQICTALLTYHITLSPYFTVLHIMASSSNAPSRKHRSERSDKTNSHVSIPRTTEKVGS